MRACGKSIRYGYKVAVWGLWCVIEGLRGFDGILLALIYIVFNTMLYCFIYHFMQYIILYMIVIKSINIVLHIFRRSFIMHIALWICG